MNKFILLIIVSVLLASCKGKPGDSRMVSVSILPQKYFVERIAGDYLKVNVMVPPGMNPATYDLNTGQLRDLYDSKIYFAVGHLPFENAHLYPALKGHEEIELINHSTKLHLIAGSCSHDHSGHGEECDHHGHHEHGVDPHIWLSPGYAHSICLDILHALNRAYPEKKEVFEENSQKLLADIATLGENLKSALAEKEQRSFLIYHPALTYLARDYEMEQISIENDGKEPGPAHLKEIIDEVKKENIHVIFIQEQFDVENAHAVAKATGCKVIQIDPLNANWLEEMNKLVTIFKEEL